MNCPVQPNDELRPLSVASSTGARDRRRSCLSVLLCGFAVAPAFSDESRNVADDHRTLEGGIVVARGQITDATGAGLIGADVRLFQARDWPDGEPIASTRTDKVGDFTLRVANTARGTFVAVVTKERFIDLVHRFDAQPKDPPEFIGATLDGDLSLAGRVVDTARGMGVAKAVVRFTSIAGDQTVRTDDEGRFAFEGISPGAAELTVHADGFGRERLTLDEIADVETALVVELKPERTVTLLVVDDRQQPIRGAVVECLDAPRDDFRAVTTDEHGQAVISGLHFDAHRVRLRLSHAAYVSSTDFDREIELPTNTPSSTHTLVMQPAGSIGGRVVDATTGDPVYGARVVTGAAYSDDSPRDWTDIKGEFTIAGVAPGTVTVTVHASDHAPDLKTVSVQAGENAEIEFALGTPGRVSGHVRNKEGGPVVDAEVVALRWRGATTLALRAVTDANGAFVMRDAPRDGFDLAVLAAGYQAWHKTVEAGASAGLDVTLERPDRSKRPRILRSGDDAPDFRVTTLDGERVGLADLKGKYVVLDFWATWCAPCVEELPNLVSLNKRYGARDDFLIISVSRDFTVSDLRGFLHRHKEFATWRHVVGRENGVEETRHAYGVGAIPRLFIISPEGKILDRDLRGHRLLARVDEIMAKAVPPASEGQR